MTVNEGLREPGDFEGFTTGTPVGVALGFKGDGGSCPETNMSFAVKSADGGKFLRLGHT